MKNRFEATDIWFDRRMLRIHWSVHMSNDVILERMETKMKHPHNTRKRQFIYLIHNMRMEGFENLIVTEHIGRKCDRGRMNN